jgi:hypothetical protein
VSVYSRDEIAIRNLGAKGVRSIDIINLDERRERKEIEAAERSGAGWWVYPLEFDDDTTVGVLDDAERPIAINCGEHLIAMNVDDARKLATALLEACESAFVPK